ELLEKYILEEEIFRTFPTYKNDCNRELFLKYTIKRLFRKKAELFDAEKISIDDNLRKKFDCEIDTTPELKNIHEKLKGRLKRNKYNEYFKRKVQLETKENPEKLKLIKKDTEEKLFTAYGRNRDRFKDFADRYLAEQN